MSRSSIAVHLRRLIEKLRVALWLHEREFDAGRRAVLFGCAAVVASTVLVHVPVDRVTGWVDFPGGLTAELNAVVRRAFVPGLYVQLWETPPLLELLRAEA